MLIKYNIKEIYILGFLIMYLNVSSDDLYRKIARKLNCNYFFSLHSININMVCIIWMEIYRLFPCYRLSFELS